MSSKSDTSGPLFSRKSFLWLLAALVVLRIILNIVVPLMDPSEARYALICKIMTENGNFLEPKLIHEGVLMNFEGKPPLYFQAGAVACYVFGIDLFAVRLPSTIFAAGLLTVLYGAIRRIKGEDVARLAVLLTLGSPVFFMYAGMCMTDMALAFCVCSAVFAYMLFDHETVRRKKKAREHRVLRRARARNARKGAGRARDGGTSGLPLCPARKPLARPQKPCLDARIRRVLPDRRPVVYPDAAGKPGFPVLLLREREFQAVPVQGIRRPVRRGTRILPRNGVPVVPDLEPAGRAAGADPVVFAGGARQTGKGLPEKRARG
ncbi:MAG: glycosyltransferase family 39 protein [Lentisphaeria bacterium]|nr:glycosyltransferase family 39 protein [Lentisphaeria bacterium]